MKDTSTRSGMLWEVERILSELKEKPQILLMENVQAVHDGDNTASFVKLQTRLEELGYKNYWEDLTATDYGIPQTRTRCFMVSVLGDYNYTFPQPQPLKIKLKDLLEDNVDKKYYLSDKMRKYIVSEDSKYSVSPNALIINRDIACSKTTREGETRADASDFICEELPNNTNIYQYVKEYQGIKPRVLGGIGEKDSNNGLQWKQQNRIYDENIAISVTTTFNPYYKNGLNIRRLTPREVFRLMGVKDSDFNKIENELSNHILFHLAGDSIVIDVLKAIYAEML